MLTKYISFILFSISVLFSLQGFGQSKSRFYSPNAQEAQLSFQYTVEFLKKGQPTETEVLTAIDKQLTFLFSAFSHQSRKAVPKAEHTVKIIKIYPVQNAWRADYFYNGQILIAQGDMNYTFNLPLNPYLIWNQGIVNNSNNHYPCTDPHYAYEKYFWYFFDPSLYGCQLKSGVHYYPVNGKLSFFANTQNTLPEYERLFVNGELTFHILFGMDNSSLDWNPHSSSDLSGGIYRQLKKVLISWGYKSKVWSKADLDHFFGTNSSNALFGNPFVEEFVKQTPKGLVRYRFFFGASTINQGLGFQKFLSYSLLNSSIMLYAGHSGLGEYLNLDLMQNHSQSVFSANKDRYQIYFFNSCSSYPYYNSQYFSLKKSALDPKGTKNLDIINNGLSTLFSSIAPSNFALMQAIEVYAVQGKKTTYQEIINKANSRNLISVNGDEDNYK